MARQFIYHMSGLSKAFSGGKKVLDDIHLSFYPDAKIGVLGPNGAGKSTLLRIMAGLESEFSGEAWAAEGARIGYLPQEPQLDPSLDVKGNVMLGVAQKQAILDRYNDLMMNYSDETAEEATSLQDQIDSAGLWDLDSKVDMAMQALRITWTYGEGNVSRGRLKQSMRIMLDRGGYAELVLADLARWKDWEVMGRIVKMYDRKGPDLRGFKISAIRYLMAATKDVPQNGGKPGSHVAQARNHLKAIKKADPKMYRAAVRMLL